MSSLARSVPPLWLLVTVTLSGTAAMHMFVPALPEAARSLGTSAGDMQMTIGIYIVGLAVGQLVYGPVSDALGRRPALLAGLALYALGGIAGALAPSLPALLLARCLQGLGGCAGLSLGRAIVRDTTEAESAVRRLALLNLIVIVGPAFAPVLGGFISAAWGWRAVLATLSAVGAVTLWLAWRLLPETCKPSRRLGVGVIARDYRELLTSPRFVGFALGGGAATTSVYAFLSAFPFVFISDLHQPPSMIGVYAGLMVAGTAIGNGITGRAIQQVKPRTLLRVGNSISLCSAAVLLLIVLAGRLSVVNAISLIALFTCGAGITSSVALMKSLSVNPRLIGSAAGLYGCAQMTIGAACTWLATVGGNPALSASVVMVTAASVAQLTFMLGLRYERAEDPG